MPAVPSARGGPQEGRPGGDRARVRDRLRSEGRPDVDSSFVDLRVPNTRPCSVRTHVGPFSAESRPRFWARTDVAVRVGAVGQPLTSRRIEPAGA